MEITYQSFLTPEFTLHSIQLPANLRQNAEKHQLPGQGPEQQLVPLKQACQTNWLGRVEINMVDLTGKKFCHHTRLDTPDPSPSR